MQMLAICECVYTCLFDFILFIFFSEKKRNLRDKTNWQKLLEREN